MKLKKIIAMMLVSVLLLTLCSCASKPAGGSDAAVETADMTAGTAGTDAESEETEPVPDPVSNLAGGWQLPDSMAYNELPDNAQAAFDKALEGYSGMNFLPLALLGTQVVAGTNYSILCKAAVVSPNPAASLKVVTIYADLDGNASITDVADFEITDYVENEDAPSPETLAGGWAVNSELSRIALADDQEKAFNTAAEGLLGVSYEPVLYLASQVVAGVNHAFLCKATTVTANPVTYLCVAVVYADLQGGATFSSFHYVDIASFKQ